jgi:hypothetical protein
MIPGINPVQVSAAVGVIKGLSMLFFTRVGVKEMFTLQNLVYFTPIPIMQVEVYSTKIPNI